MKSDREIIADARTYNLKKLGIEKKPGKYGDQDYLITLHGKYLNMKILGTIYQQIIKAENNLDPAKVRSEKLAKFLKEVRECGGLNERIMKKYDVLNWNIETTATFSGKSISMEAFAEIYSEMCRIQNFRYPRGKGALYIAEYFEDIRKRGALTPEIKAKYKVR